MSRKEYFDSYGSKRLKSGKLTPAAQKIVDKYVSILKGTHKYPNRTTMADAGIARDTIREYFGTMEGLKKYVTDNHPNILEEVTEERIKQNGEPKVVASVIKKHKRFLITSAISGAEAHEDFVHNLRLYCRKNDASLLIIPVNGDISAMDEELVDETWIQAKTFLNSNIYISDILPSPKAVNPLTGISRIGQRNGSTIVGSPKQFLEYVAVADNKMPHAIMSTGSVTKPFYYSPKGQKRKNDIIADHDHVMGAIVVEIENDKIFHFRQIQAQEDGGFVDLGRFYSNGKVVRMRAEAFYIGDYHVTETDPTAAKAWDEVCEYVGVNRLIHGDFFSGSSINHHEEENQIRRAQLSEDNGLSLEKELRLVAEALNRETEKCKEVIILASNHHDFLSNHYLPHGTYYKDPQNLKFASQLIAPMIGGHDPVRYAIEKLIGVKRPERIRWLARDESFKVAGIELGAHGDKGANGSKGSPNTLEKAYGKCVVGHSHTPKIIRGFWQVGTSTFLKLPYTIGSSSWVQTSCLVYANGARQLINSIGGKWRLK